MLDPIVDVDSPAFQPLVRRLAERAGAVDAGGNWPGESLADCMQAGVPRWFLAEAQGGRRWSEPDLLKAYVRLAGACMTTTFILTQFLGACKRIAAAPEFPGKDKLLHDLLAGRAFATVGISHLTTSRRHLGRPALAARRDGQGFLLDGYSPWVTGAEEADWVVMGAALEDGQQIVTLVSTSLPGIVVDQPQSLTALNGSRTGAVRLEGVRVEAAHLLTGPMENVLGQGAAGAGGLQTSALAVGLARAASQFLLDEAARRTELVEPAEALASQTEELLTDLLAASVGEGSCSSSEIRQRANGLALRTSQAALGAAKGAGYVSGHPAGRWCRESLFFLVWSCPAPVQQAHLCELAGLESL
ncbi:MAG TPA: acyl-CoA dehydrogenase family protein [Pirellulaceae bacterium]|jgi:alkylation response protein AidB-like acyl-CoA dehydrogenase|nr:acyl-CoA dehydrogenase family protein [Pirellulaceae bacterium]